MQKLGLGIGVVVVAGAAALPMISGHLGYQALEQEVARINEPGIEVALLPGESSYLNSTAVTEIKVVDPAMIEAFAEAEVPTTIQLQHQFSHGLFSLSGETRLAYSDEQKELIEELWGEGADPIRLQTKTNWMGQTAFDFTVDGFEFSDEEDKVSWSTLTAHGTGQADGSLVFQMSWPGVSITGPEEAIKLEQIEASGDGAVQYGMWIGEQRFSMQKAALESPQLNVELAQLEGLMTNEKQGDVYGGRSELSLAKLSVAERLVENLKIQFNAEGFDADAIETLSSNQNMQSDEEIQAFIAALDKLIARGFSLQIEPISADLPEGPLSGDVQITLQEGLEQASVMPMLVMQQLDGSIHLKLPMSLMENPLWSEEINSLLQMGFLVPEGDSLLLDASIKPGEAPQINGQPLPM